MAQLPLLALLAAMKQKQPGRATPLLDAFRAQRGESGPEADGIEGVVDDQPLRLPPGVVVERDLSYGEAEAQRLDVYRPAAAQAAPVVFYVHGGGWQRGDKAMPQMVRHKSAHYTGKGMVFVSTNYRLLPEADVLAQADDVCRALAFVQAQAAAWGGDGGRVVVVGHSAGAHLVALLSADPGLAMRHGVQPWLGTIALDSAALDMVAVMKRPHFRFYDAVFGRDQAFWRQASPTLRLQGQPAAPMLMVCSTRRTDSCPPAQEFADKANRLGGCVEVLPVDLTHREINDQLGLPGDYTSAVDTFLDSLGVG